MGDQKPISIKLILLGDSAVGKSSLVRRFVDNNFFTNEPATIGYDFRPFILNVDGEDVQFNIWDTAGAERHGGSLTPAFYRNANGALYVYDVTCVQSLKSIDHWADQLNQYLSVPIITMLVGNKIDLPERVISKRDGSDFARRAGMIFVETSAKTSENVRDAFIELVRKILQDPAFRSSCPDPKIPLISLEPDSDSAGTCSC